MMLVLQSSCRAASATEISPGRYGSGTGILQAWRMHWTASMSSGGPWTMRCPAAFSRVTSWSLLVLGPSRLTSSMAAAGERRAVPGWMGLVAVSSSAVPADPDPSFAAVGFGQQGDVGDQGAQQPLAVLGGGGAGVPGGAQVGGEF